MNKPKLLIVDDDEAIRTQLKYALRDDFTLLFAEDRSEAMTALEVERPSIVSLDLGLPPRSDSGAEGLQALDEIMKLAPETKVIVLTGNGDRDNALRAVQLGAFDYHQKPIQLAEFKIVLGRAAYLQTLEIDAEKQQRAAETTTRFEDILGNTPVMREIFGVVARVARTDVTVLIQGESGTGKELLARAIHAHSPRRKGPFVAINCGAIPETLLESELFGHEKGAYTGAHIQRKGKLEMAEGGALFLDEIGEMSVPLQVKLLRFLQEREIERVGGREVLRVDARVIAATNKDLKSELQAGRFREDLYYRLSVVNLKLPPLRERGEDIVLIANAFLRRTCKQHRRKLRFGSAALEAIAHYGWPGNIRELENAVERAVIMAHAKLIEARDLGIEIADGADLASLRQARDRAEREALVDALVKTRGNISQAAKLLGVSRPTFHGLIAKNEVNARDFR
ncbi:MAG: PEP-CTERM-box response regulator transcription factor [Candidatus Rokuibacteriota bacterium]|nr:MAG: PEP-CTERM-box response regulator transcription factor [Candidatus Rokubacteria bacterium]PYN57457.1 MAG: PEP-CTERM-box response regulator transcription factor [Candidatus Rokubacteria bacterium]